MALLDSLGKRLKALRADLGLSQKEVAHRSHTSQAYLSRIEGDHVRNVRGPVLARIAEVLGTTTDYLLGLSTDPLPPPEMVEDDLPADVKILYQRIERLPPAVRDQAVEYLIEEVERMERLLQVGRRLTEREREVSRAPA